MAKPNKNKRTRVRGYTYTDVPQVGKTIAKLNDCKYDALNLLNKIVNNNTEYFELYFADELKMSDSFTATVKVGPGDVYDAQEGRKLAAQKAKAKYHKEMDRILRDFLKDIRNLAAGLEHHMDKVGVSYDEVPSVDAIKRVKFQNRT